MADKERIGKPLVSRSGIIQTEGFEGTPQPRSDTAILG